MSPQAALVEFMRSAGVDGDRAAAAAEVMRQMIEAPQAPPPAEERDWMTLAEAASKLRCSVRTLHRDCQHGRVPFYLRAGKQGRFFKPEELDAIFERRQEDASAKARVQTLTAAAQNSTAAAKEKSGRKVRAPLVTKPRPKLGTPEVVDTSDAALADRRKRLQAQGLSR